jgi:diguanylate cyclase (GGDEF)-like protein
MIKKSVILIADDVESNVEILSSILQKDYHIKVAKDGIEALELIKEEPIPDLILLDVEMPMMNGYEVLQELDDEIIFNKPSVIFVTGNNTFEDEEKGLLLGAVDYIKKPLNAAVVKARIHTQLMQKRHKDALAKSAFYDQLTGLHNRHHLVDEGSRKFSRAKRTGDKLSVIMLDIDKFKILNDTHGHLMGDKVLKAIGGILNYNKREEDFCARFGGEEFVIVLEGCSSQDAAIKAQDLRKTIEALNPSGIAVTSSFGVCEIHPSHQTFESLLKDADSCLYEAKERGRNQVVEFKGGEL